MKKNDDIWDTHIVEIHEQSTNQMIYVNHC